MIAIPVDGNVMKTLGGRGLKLMKITSIYNSSDIRNFITILVVTYANKTYCSRSSGVITNSIQYHELYLDTKECGNKRLPGIDRIIVLAFRLIE